MISQYRLCVPATGLSSVLGGMNQACAAFCAGIKLPQKSITFELHDSDEEQAQPLSIMGLPKSAFAYTGVARFSLNLAEAILDASAKFNFDKKIPFVLMLPDPNDRGLEGEWQSEELIEARVNLFGKQIMAAVGYILGAEMPELDCHFCHADHTGIAKALNFYQYKHLNSDWNTCLIGAVDSLLNNDTLEFLLNEDKFKCEDTPTGFVPAESAGVFVISPSQMEGVVFDCIVETGELITDDEQNLMPSSCHFKLIDIPAEESKKSLLISDINGEQFRAYEWGNLLLKLHQNNFANDFTETYYPVETFGESGTSTGFVSWLIALHCLSRKIFSSVDNIILSLSDGERKDRALISLSRI